MRCLALALSIAAVSVGCAGSASSDRDEGCVRTFTGHSDRVCSVALSPDGKQIVSGGADGKIKFWDVDSGQCQRTLDGHKEWVQCVALSPDARFLASCGGDGLIKLWDVEPGKLQRTFAENSGLVQSVAYSPNGRLLASCGRGESFKIWEVTSGKCLKSLDSGGFFTASAVQFSPDSKELLFGGDSLQLWDVDSGERRRTFVGHSDSVGAIAISRNGKWAASAGKYTDSTVRLWDVTSGNCLWKKDFIEREGGGAWSLVFALDDEVLVSGHHDGTIRYWDVKSGRPLCTVNAHSGIVDSLSADMKGQYLASGSWDKCIRLWKMPLGDLARR